VLDETVTRLIAEANAARQYGKSSDAERQLESLFGVSRLLAVYGSLAPGRQNYSVVAPLGGEWTSGVVEGDLIAEGWGATLGFPALWPRAGGPDVAVQVLESAALVGAWGGLDVFEGAEYRRILVPVFGPGPAGARPLYTVANIYAAAMNAPTR
jgi:gamma-glutamylcyclotransferase (GGCT)/AIG2-like uncharacterized protein YtfP